MDFSSSLIIVSLIGDVSFVTSFRLEGAAAFTIVLRQGPRQHGFLGSEEPIDFEKWVPGTHQFLTKLTN